MSPPLLRSLETQLSRLLWEDENERLEGQPQSEASRQPRRLVSAPPVVTAQSRGTGLGASSPTRVPTGYRGTVPAESAVPPISASAAASTLLRMAAASTSNGVGAITAAQPPRQLATVDGGETSTRDSPITAAADGISCPAAARASGAARVPATVPHAASVPPVRCSAALSAQRTLRLSPCDSSSSRSPQRPWTPPPLGTSATQEMIQGAAVSPHPAGSRASAATAGNTLAPRLAEAPKATDARGVRRGAAATAVSPVASRANDFSSQTVAAVPVAGVAGLQSSSSPIGAGPILPRAGGLSGPSWAASTTHGNLRG